MINTMLLKNLNVKNKVLNFKFLLLIYTTNKYFVSCTQYVFMHVAQELNLHSNLECQKAG